MNFYPTINIQKSFFAKLSRDNCSFYRAIISQFIAVVMNKTDKIRQGQIQIDDKHNYRPLSEPMVKETHSKVLRLLLRIFNVKIILMTWQETPNPPGIPEFYTLTLSISEKCQQYAIDSKVYLIGNAIDPWHNWLETLGTRLLREETIVKTPSGLFTSELKQMAFTAIRRRNSWFLTKSERKKYKSTLDISHDGF